MSKETTHTIKKARDLADHHEAKGNLGTALVLRDLCEKLEEKGEAPRR